MRIPPSRDGHFIMLGYDSDGIVVVLARQLENAKWHVYIKHRGIGMIQDRKAKPITSNSPQELKAALKSEYPRWYDSFIWRDGGF